MNKEHFALLMGAVDNDLLEEAQCPVRKTCSWLWVSGMAAACVVVLIAAYFLMQPNGHAPRVVSPERAVTAADVELLGYALPVPEDAQEVRYSLITLEDQAGTLMAEVDFGFGGHSYSCRTLKTEQPEDISGIYEEWAQSLDWTAGTLEMQMRQSENSAWVGWYAPDAGVQWCISGDDDALSLLHTAQSIVEILGYDIAVAPENAENVLYNAFELDGLTVGETVFTLDGVSYSYRMAATWAVEEDFADISGLEEEFQNQTASEIMWCPARLSFDEGGAGKVVWFDVAPGLLYSLSMDQDASEETLLTLANQLFSPAQGDVG